MCIEKLGELREYPNVKHEDNPEPSLIMNMNMTTEERVTMCLNCNIKFKYNPEKYGYNTKDEVLYRLGLYCGRACTYEHEKLLEIHNQKGATTIPEVGVHSSEWKRRASQVDDDIVFSCRKL